MRLGIDPGVTGALALISGDTVVRCWDMPIWTEGTREGKKRSTVNCKELAEILRSIQWYFAPSESLRPIVYVELQQPNMGASKGRKDSAITAFSVGFNYGIVIACIELIFGKDSYISVHPMTWKTTAKLKKKDKHAALECARRTLQTSDWLLRKKDIGRADAMLIAYHG